MLYTLSWQSKAAKTKGYTRRLLMFAAHCTVMLDNLFWRHWALTICQNKPVGMIVNNSKGFFKIS